MRDGTVAAELADWLEREIREGRVTNREAAMVALRQFKWLSAEDVLAIACEVAPRFLGVSLKPANEV